MFLSLSSFAIRPQDQEQTTYQKCVKRIKRHSRPKPPRGACIYCLSTLTAANQQEWPIFRAIYGHQNNPPMASFKSDIKGKCTIIPRCCGGGYRNRTGLLGFAIDVYLIIYLFINILGYFIIRVYRFVYENVLSESYSSNCFC